MERGRPIPSGLGWSILVGLERRIITMRYLVCLCIMLVSMAFLSGTAFSAEHPAHGVAPGEGLKEQHGAEHPGAVLSAADVIKGIKEHSQDHDQ